MYNYYIANTEATTPTMTLWYRTSPFSLSHYMMHDKDWETTGRIASLLGAIKVEQHGTQNHEFTMAEFAKRFEENFDFSL